ncbi:MAG: hypothetical protein EA366_06080 [Spirulina sp. DLM2.Bin59]|nr:MAG: hypothetical protein EA366_06080 [Spirulina sp. DLM2.Bin59]
MPRHQFLPPDQPNNLQVLIQGSANNIKIGVAAEHPVNEIRGSFLEQFFPADVINALLTFSAVAISYLIPWLFSTK